jgi:hemerythrin superfamily protein
MKSKKSAARKQSGRKTAGRKKSNGKQMSGRKTQSKGIMQKMMGNNSALEMLKDDHKMVQKLFDQYRKLMKEEGNEREKQNIAEQVCDMLTIHAQIEEELFYPAVRRAMEEKQDKEIVYEALVEHDGAKDLIAQMEEMSPGDKYYDATFKVLGEQVKHHVKEEEGTLFPKVKKLGLDLEALGEEMKYRKEELEDRMYSSGGMQQMQQRGRNTGSQQYQGGYQ